MNVVPAVEALRRARRAAGAGAAGRAGARSRAAPARRHPARQGADAGAGGRRAGAGHRHLRRCWRSGVPRPNLAFALVLANLVVLLLLGAVLAGRLTRVWVERRRGSAGSRLHVRLVLLFSVVAVIPTIVVAVFSTFFFNFGIQAWFNDGCARRCRKACRSAAAIWRSTATTSAPTRWAWPTT